MRHVPTVVLAASIPLFSLAPLDLAAAEDLITGTATYELSLDASKADGDQQRQRPHDPEHPAKLRLL